MHSTIVVSLERIDGLASCNDEPNFHFTIRMKIDDQHKRTTELTCGSSRCDINQKLTFKVDPDSNEDIVIEALDKANRTIAKGITKLSQLTAHKVKRLDMPSERVPNVSATIHWSYEPKKDEGAERKAKGAKGTMATSEPQRELSTKETHRPSFMRAKFYYDTTKSVYTYTTSFPVIAKLARMGESGTNSVLQRISGKSLNDLDQNVLVPAFETFDNKLDGTITAVLTKLFEGQQYVLKKKNDAVGGVSAAAKSSSETVSNAVGNTVHGVVHIFGSAMHGVVRAKDYTTNQVTNVSSSAYGTLRSTTLSLLSHMPFVGAKVST